MGMTDRTAMGLRRFGRVNWLGLYTLAERETKRFLAVWTQTLLAPLVTAGLLDAPSALNDIVVDDDGYSIVGVGTCDGLLDALQRGRRPHGQGVL